MARAKRSEDYYIKVLLEKAKVKEIMTTPVISVSVLTPFSQVEEIFRTRGIRHLPVVADGHILAGLITQRDLYRIVSPRKTMEGGVHYDKDMLDEIILSRVMIDKPVVVREADSVGLALLAMVKGKYGCLPVVNDKYQLCGIVTQIDILKIAAEIIQGL